MSGAHKICFPPQAAGHLINLYFVRGVRPRAPRLYIVADGDVRHAQGPYTRLAASGPTYQARNDKGF